MLKRWALPIVLLYGLALTVGSLAKTGGMPELGSSYDDKIYHTLAYTIFTILVYNGLRFKSRKSRIFTAVALVIAYGIIIELLQYLFTSYRTLDGYDILANAMGALLAMSMLLVRREMKLKKNAELG